MRVPKFQRSFVWDTDDVIRLFDSLYRGFPIGTLLVWSQPLQAGMSKFGPLSFSTNDEPGGFMVVDGQQRITSLVGTFLSDAENTDERFDIQFDIEQEKFVKRPPYDASGKLIPVREVLESRRLLAWLRANGEDFTEEELATADNLGGALRDYKIPVYVVQEDDEQLLRVVFDRVNSSGKPISRAQIFHALFAGTSDQGSPASVVDQVARTGFGRIDESRVVQSLLAIRGGDVQRDIHEEFSSNEDPLIWYDRTETALNKAVSFLQSEGIPHVLLMPTMAPVPILAAYFGVHANPEPYLLKMLSKWLWRGWMFGFGRDSGQSPAIRKAVQAINPKKGGANPAPAFEAAEELLRQVEPGADSGLSADIFRLDGFSTDARLGRLVLLALLSLEPRSPDGETIDVTKALDEYGTSAIGQFVASSRTSAANRGFVLPSWPVEWKNSKNVEFWESQAVTPEAYQAISADKQEHFLSLRLSFIQDLIINFYRSKVDLNFTARRPVADLMVKDPNEQR